MNNRLALVLSALLATPGLTYGANATPRRQDFGSLIVLDVCGSYYEMGRQQAELLGEVGKRLVEYQIKAYDRGTTGLGLGFRVFELFSWFNGLIGPYYEKSGAFDETRGIIDGLGLSRRNAGRFTLGAFFSGSTALLATRTATADGQALMVRNVDFEDGYGARPPVLVRYHPDNGDLKWISVAWPLSTAPAVGMNEAGLAFSFNLWGPDDLVAMWLPEFPFRRVLEKATTVEDGIRIFTSARALGLAGLFSMADANGNIAMVECTAKECAVYRPGRDWFCVTNHALTEKMKKLDKAPTEDSYLRLAEAERAMQPLMGHLTPNLGAGILRDRSSPYINGSNVGALFALDSAIVHPASRTIWVSTTMQPFAPFGEYLPFTFGDSSKAPPIPADAGLGSPEMKHEADIIRELREAVRLFRADDIQGSGAILDRLANSHEQLIDPYRLAWARARVRWTLGQLVEADNLLWQADQERAPFEVRAFALTMRGVIADRLGLRQQAMMFYERARNYLAANPQYTVRSDLTDSMPIGSMVAEGLQRPLTQGPIPATPDLQHVPH